MESDESDDNQQNSLYRSTFSPTEIFSEVYIKSRLVLFPPSTTTKITPNLPIPVPFAHNCLQFILHISLPISHSLTRRVSPVRTTHPSASIAIAECTVIAIPVTSIPLLSAWAPNTTANKVGNYSGSNICLSSLCPMS